MSEPDNAQRAAWAQEAIDVFAAATGLESERNSETDDIKLADLFVDLRHWADQQGLDFDLIAYGSAQTYDVNMVHQGNYRGWTQYRKMCPRENANPSDDELRKMLDECPSWIPV